MVFSLLVASLAHAQSHCNYTVDMYSRVQTLPHYWENCVGSCHAYMGLRDDFRAQLQYAKANAGFNHIRFHGIFDDDMGVLTMDSTGKITYNWEKVNSVLDMILSVGVRPLIEMSFMPFAIASCNKTVFYYKGNICPPKQWKQWYDLVFAFGKHLINRYTEAEIKQWWFEVWNEPNLLGGAGEHIFWEGDQTAYFTLYEHSAWALKNVSASFRVGGPATAQGEWLEDMVAWTRARKVPLDFLSTHGYPTDPQRRQPFRGATEEQVVNASIVAANAKLPLLFDEYNSGLYEEKVMNHDLSYAAAHVIHNVPRLINKAEIFSYWTFSDIFEEGGFDKRPFHNGFGLITIDGIPKPAFHAFEWLHGLGSHSLPITAHPTARSTSSSSASASCGTTSAIASPHTKSNGLTLLLSNYDVIESPPGAVSVNITIANFPPGNTKATIEYIDESHANPLQAWKDLGSPDPLSAKQIETLKTASKPVATAIHVENHGRHVSVSFKMLPNSAARLHVTI